jgi:Na+/citrate or Na+/malate symporter
MGMSIAVFLTFSMMVVVATMLGVLPKGLVGAVPFMMVLGAILNEVGNRTPIIKDFFGGGPIVIIFGSAALFTYQIIPTAVTDIVVTFTKAGGLLNFYIAALITGSILGMDRKLLMKASLRYLPAILGGIVVALDLVVLSAESLDMELKKQSYILVFQLWVVAWTPALLVGIGAAYTDLGAVISAFTLQYILLVAVVIFGAIVGSGFVG